MDGATLPVAPSKHEILPAIIGEILGTFLLVYVILNVATTKDTAGNSYYGLAIGFTVIGISYLFGPLSGGSFNPAVALGMCLSNMVLWGEYWMHLVGAVVGGVLAVYAFFLSYGRGD